jgi:photosystem II stability/assembly factor-like uncharacterized protein
MKYLLIIIIVIFYSIEMTAQTLEWTPMSSPNIGRADDISFFNENEGTMLEPNLGFLTTWNGGIDWRNELIDSTYKHNALFSVKPQYLYAAALNKKNGKGGFFVSNSKGFQWYHSPHIFNNALVELHFFDRETGIVMDDKDSVYYTDDFGQSFAFLYAFTQKINAFEMLGDRLWAVGESGAILYSDDNAANWTDISLKSTENINSIKFLENGDIVICGDAGFLAKSTDQGSTWEKKQLGNVTLHSVDFLDNKKGIVVGGNSESGACYITDDGGNNWLKESIPDAEYFDVAYKEESVAIAVGLFHESDDFAYGYISYGEKITDVKDYQTTSELRVYPNPAINYVVIEGTGVAKISLISANGQTIRYQDYQFGNQLNLEEIPTGVYYLKIDQCGSTKTQKITILAK